MRILMQMKWDGFTPENYEKIRKSIKWEENMPAGALLHMVGFQDNAIRVTDVWESAEHLNDFVQNRLMPGTQAAGIKGEPQVEVFPLHALFVPALQRI